MLQVIEEGIGCVIGVSKYSDMGSSNGLPAAARLLLSEFVLRDMHRRVYVRQPTRVSHQVQTYRAQGTQGHKSKEDTRLSV